MKDVKRLNTTLSLEAYRILEKYKEEYGSQKKTLEAALSLLEKDRCRLKTDHERIWFAIREELNGVAIGKRLFKYLVENRKEEAYKNRVIDRLVEWILKKPIETEDFRKILDALKLAYETTNIFEHIEIVEEDDNRFSITFFHSLGIKVSEFYTEYLRHFFEDRCGVGVRSFIRDTHFTFQIERSSSMG
jgi:hypothetical protein